MEQSQQTTGRPRLLIWNPSKLVYNPDVDLRIRKEWLPKYTVIRVTGSRARIRV